MNAVAKLLSADDILFDIDVPDKALLLENIAQFFEWRHGVNAELVRRSLSAREELGSTGIGHGVAIPHARMKGLTNTVGVFVRPLAALEFDAPDSMPVQLVLALLVPEHIHRAHLDLLAAAAQLFSTKQFREQLLASTSPAQAYSLFAAA